MHEYNKYLVESPQTMLSKGLFIVGCPRSGTSRLQAAVSSHPEIAIGLERYVLRAFRGDLTSADFEENRFFSIEPEDTWYKDLSQFKRVYDPLRAKYASANIHGDKIPRGFFIYDKLARCFDKTYFLCCLRNIFSVAVSYERRRLTTKDWDPSWDYKVAVQHWNASIKKTLEAMQYLPVLPILYEEMHSGSNTVARMGDFLGVKTEPFDQTFSQMDKVHKPTTETISLSEEALSYICQNADFAGYKRLYNLALNPPKYQLGHVTKSAASPIVDKYSKDDAAVIDYQSYQLEGTPYKMRGPKPTGRIEDAIVCLGSAATFGRLVPKPFATTLARELNVPVFNFGIGGARPVTYLDKQPIKDMLASCKAVIVEVMSARGYKTNLFTPSGVYTNMGAVSEQANLKLTTKQNGIAFVDHVYSAALEEKRYSELFKALCELRATYISDMLELAHIVGKKAVLLYFSQRNPGYSPTTTNYLEWSGGFPHFVDQHTIDLLKPSFKHFVQHVSHSGLPSECRDKSTGELVPIFGGPKPAYNTYYPSQEMNDEVAVKLLPAVRTLL